TLCNAFSPYTTLFRSLTELIPTLLYAQSSNRAPKHPKGASAMNGIQELLPDPFAILRSGELIHNRPFMNGRLWMSSPERRIANRSEEHTSELQSRENL